MRRPGPADGVAWVTGASSGIGRAVALELARRGWSVAATARRRPELDALAVEAAGLSGHITACPGDVTDREGIAGVLASIEAAGSAVALAFLNVGTFMPDAAEDFGSNGFRRTFAINVEGTINCLEPLLRLYRMRGLGQVAINASVAGYGGLPRAVAYGATKAALINMAASLKFDLDRLGLVIQIVCPGFVRTPLTDQNDFPMPFLVEPDEAGRRICDGFQRGGFEIAFPRRLVWLLKALNMLPYAAYFPAVARMTGR